LKRLSNNPSPIPASQFKASGIPWAPLEAMMLDTKTTFDEVVHRYAKSKASAQRIINNRFYQATSSALSGTHEYMAMEKLYELSKSGLYETIVVDTPPTRNALDFLDAPDRMSSFLEGRLLRWFLIPTIGGGKGLFRLANLAAINFLKVLRRIIGADVLEETAEFFANFEGMYEGFKERAQAVYALLQKQSTSFVVITSPSAEAIDEALFFASRLNSHKFAFRDLVVNRIHPSFEAPEVPETAPALVKVLSGIARELNQLRAKEQAGLKRLAKEVKIRKWSEIPYLTQEATDLNALRQIAGHLFPPA